MAHTVLCYHRLSLVNKYVRGMHGVGEIELSTNIEMTSLLTGKNEDERCCHRFGKAATASIAFIQAA